MPWIQQYSCDKCQRLVNESTGISRKYKVSWQDEGVMSMQRTVWCTHCDDLCAAEALPELSGLLAIKKDYEDRKFSIQSGLDESAHIQILVSLIRWRQERQSPARCLECGSSSIQLLLQQHESDVLVDFEHPICGGTFRPFGESMHFIPRYTFEYDSEGQAL